jgi:hypothetical protein
MLIVVVVACLMLQLGIGYFAGVNLGVWSYSDSSALLLLGMSSGTLTLGLIEYLYVSRIYAVLWSVYLLLSPVTVVFAVN